jgi:enoyl-CoA hydratase
MLSCDRKSLLGYKRLIDEGFGMTFAEAVEMEARVARENAATVTAEAIARRREAVRDRGRSQTAG